jgi:Tfp pilus assembly protein PilE
LNPGVQDNAQKALEKYRADCKKRREKNSKRKNLATTNLADFDEAFQQRIKEQVLQSTTKSDGEEGTSVISAVTLQSKPQSSSKKSKSGGYIFIVDVQVLSAGSTTKKPMPITIQSTLPHIVLQLGNDLDCPNCPSI